MNIRIRTIVLIIIFIISNYIVYYITHINENQRIKIALDQHLDKLETNLKVYLYHKKMSADSAYLFTIQNKKVIEILSKANQTTSKKQRSILRKQLYNVLKIPYSRMNIEGIYQYHFVLPNNITFLRMHKPSKFDDNLSKIRYSFQYTNKTHKAIRGFEKGKTEHAFRNTYPIFDKNKNYLGCVGIDFTSENLQDYLTTIRKIHIHFLVNKDVLDHKVWNRDDINIKYLPSSEDKHYMVTMTKDHSKEKCIIDNSKKLENIKDDIKDKLIKKDPFVTYTLYKDTIRVISFDPIKNIKDNKVVAWLVSYEKDDFIYLTLKGNLIIRTTAFCIMILLFYFIYRVINQKDILELEVRNKTVTLVEANKKLEEKDYKLREINENLEQKIIIEIDKNNKIQQHLFKSEKLAAMGEMIGNIAHQWRQPLSVISTSATGMLMQKEYDILTDEMFKNNCLTIDENAQYLSRTIDDFKNFIKGDRTKKIFNLTNSINSFLHLVDGSIKVNNINIILDLDDSIKIDGYENELIQCFMNIFNNSKDALKENNIQNKLIFITTISKDTNIEIRFKDNANGIPKNILPKVFEPYFTTKHKSQGTGLGLHMTYNLIVDGMHGSIDVYNKTYIYNQQKYTGAEFRIILSV